MSAKKKIAICGLGYVGLPLGIRFAEAGIQVIGLDIDESKVNSLNKGLSYIKNIESSQLNRLVKERNFYASKDFSIIAQVEAVLICVPTPLGSHREPDISYVLSTGKKIAPFLKRLPNELKPLVVLESTTYPGTTDEDLRILLEKESGLLAGKDFHLAYSPEREDQVVRNILFEQFLRSWVGSPMSALDDVLNYIQLPLIRFIPFPLQGLQRLQSLWRISSGRSISLW